MSAPVPIPGKLVYLTGGSAWIMEGSTSIRRPLVTEKSNYQSGKLHQYTFEVNESATRTLVKDAIEKLFDVKVVRVNIINTAGKRSLGFDRQGVGCGQRR